MAVGLNRLQMFLLFLFIYFLHKKMKIKLLLFEMYKVGIILLLVLFHWRRTAIFKRNLGRCFI
jgi:hypothetical protein